MATQNFYVHSGEVDEDSSCVGWLADWMAVVVVAHELILIALARGVISEFFVCSGPQEVRLEAIDKFDIHVPRVINK